MTHPFLSRVIDEDAALQSLARFVFGGDDVQKTFVAAALVYLDCGHVRPMNVWFEPGDPLECVICGQSTVTALELIAPTEFPTVDSLADLKHGCL